MNSYYAAIENAFKHLIIYTTAQWEKNIQTTRKGHPYVVKEMIQLDFVFDLKARADMLKNFDLTERRENVNISKSRHISYIVKI